MFEQLVGRIGNGREKMGSLTMKVEELEVKLMVSVMSFVIEARKAPQVSNFNDPQTLLSICSIFQTFSASKPPKTLTSPLNFPHSVFPSHLHPALNHPTTTN
jgi:hypothetical protein